MPRHVMGRRRGGRGGADRVVARRRGDGEQRHAVAPFFVDARRTAQGGAKTGQIAGIDDGLSVDAAFKLVTS